ncbi:hypothetical protein KI387_019306, partial [Taxus chinensis]
AKIPITLELPALHLAKAVEDEHLRDSFDKRIMYLTRIEEERVDVVNRISAHQQKAKRIFDKNARQRDFQVGDL